MDVPAQEVREKEFTLPQRFCSLLALKGLHDARPQGEDRSSVLSLLVQTITPPGNVLADKLTSMFTSYLGVLIPVS